MGLIFKYYFLECPTIIEPEAACTKEYTNSLNRLTWLYQFVNIANMYRALVIY